MQATAPILVKPSLFGERVFFRQKTAPAAEIAPEFIKTYGLSG
jgi:hypothetical protein